MNNNLTPVQRPDRNGKMVTRHVKVTAAPESQKPIPSPMVSTTPDSAPENAVSMEEYEDGITLVASRVRTNSDVNMNLKSIANHLPDGFRELIKEFSTADDYKAELWGHMLRWQNKDRPWFSKALLIELHVMETVAELHPDPIGSFEVSGRASIARGRDLMSAARLSLSEYGGNSSIMRRKATIFALWAQKFRDADDRINLTTEDENIDYIAENFSAVMANRHVIRDRGTIDRGTIALLISNASPAISEGAL